MSTIKTNTLLALDGTQTTEPSIPALDQRMAKAFVNFDGTTTSIRDSYNVSSITDRAAGRQTVNLAVAMSDTNYIAILGLPAAGGTGLDDDRAGACSIQTTSTIHTSTSDQGPTDNSYTDCHHISVIVFGS